VHVKLISLHVPGAAYDELKSLAAAEGRPVAELIREAMSEYLSRERRSGRSVLEIEAHDGGRLRKGWTRSGLFDEMLRR
jgi:hypothetical protein